MILKLQIILVLVVMAISTGVNASEYCPLIQIADNSNGTIVDIKEFPASNRPAFARFVTEISEFVSNKLSTTACTGASEARVLFIYTPLVIPGHIKPVNLPSDDKKNGGDICCLRSPWVTLMRGGVERNNFNAVFVWNERQFIIDQAIMDNIDFDKTVLTPLSQESFAKYAQNYADMVILAESQEERLTALESIQKKIPPDMLWLFAHSWQSTLASFEVSARKAASNAVEYSSDGYIDLIKSLVDKGIECHPADIHYKNIKDLHDISGVLGYRVNNSLTGRKK